MPEGMFLGVERPFVEEREDTIKLIVEFSDKLTDEDLREESNAIVAQIEDSGFIINDVRTDPGITPFLILEMGTTNIDFSVLDQLNDRFIEIEGYRGLTISTVNLGSIERLARKR